MTVSSLELILFHQALVFISVWFTHRESSEALREMKITQTLYSSGMFLLLWSCFQLSVIPLDFLILTHACDLQADKRQLQSLLPSIEVNW